MSSIFWGDAGTTLFLGSTPLHPSTSTLDPTKKLHKQGTTLWNVDPEATEEKLTCAFFPEDRIKVYSEKCPRF